MKRNEETSKVPCKACREFFSAHYSINYLLQNAEYMCAPCALQRKGKYDADTNRWTHAPDITGLNAIAPGDQPANR